MTEVEYNQMLYNMFSRIVGCAFKSYNYWHENVDELCYEAGLYMELEEAGFALRRQEEFPIFYKGKPTPVKRRMDLVASDKYLGNVILELKAVNYVGDEHRRQLWSYLKLTGIRYGMLINFSPKGVFSENWIWDEETCKCKRV